MAYVLAPNNTVEKFPYSIGELKSAYPDTSFPARPSDTMLASYDVYTVTIAPLPTYDPATQNVARNAVPTLTNGVWTLDHTVVDKTQAEILESLPFKTAGEAKAAMVGWIDALTAQIMATYPKAVQARWQIEEEAARAVKAGTANQQQTDLVTNEGAAKGRTAAQHADAIIANADRFHAIVGQINALFLATDKALDEATDASQYEAILDAAKAQAAPLAAAYGLSG